MKSVGSNLDGWIDCPPGGDRLQEDLILVFTPDISSSRLSCK